ncbi:hypothetical protein CCAND93_530008 [Capnocytophaga canis]|uniref:Uncharacterized protein n=1 Tax=Capnocytophaga canis TaxID=1848903 RepID=A0A0B7IPC9_9FLAO|nr:hypothetical protein CCAND93_530008 [Capnocytophaga canis]
MYSYILIFLEIRIYQKPNELFCQLRTMLFTFVSFIYRIDKHTHNSFVKLLIFSFTTYNFRTY